MTMVLTIIALCFLGLHAFTAWIVARRMRAARATSTHSQTPLTIIRPICGLEYRLEDCLRTSFLESNAPLQIIISAASPDDPAVKRAQAVIDDYPNYDALLVTGEEMISANPKLNNCASAYAHAKYDRTAIIDSNVIIPEDFLEMAADAWARNDTGMVSSPAIARDLSGFWSHFEAGFLNSNQARLQLFADEYDHGFAQGKCLFYEREILDETGGLPALGSELAEDAASTKLMRKSGHRVSLLQTPVTQPLGLRSASAVWQRQLRWARLRRSAFPWLYAGEFMNGSALAFFAAWFGFGASAWATFFAFVFAWYAIEILFARLADCSAKPVDVAAWVLRDAALPVVWLLGWFGTEISWRGNEFSQGETRPSGARGAQ